MKPIYVEVKNERLEKTLDRVKELIKEIEEETGWLRTKEPTLCAVPAPEDDCISVGNIIVYGVSSLSEEAREQIRRLLADVVAGGLLG